MTPYGKLTGNKPDLSYLRIFGSCIVTRKPGRRSPKISKHSYSGIFLCYAKTMKNIVYLGTQTRKIKTTTFAKFDEAHFSHQDKPPGAKILIKMGMREIDKQNPIKIPPSEPLQIVKMHKDAISPCRGSDKAAGYDLFSIQDYVIPPNTVGLIDTDIAAKFPSGTYGRLAGRSGLVLHNSITVLGGVLDPDYTGTGL